MAIITESGRIAIARAIQNESVYLAWGSGDPDWDASSLTESLDAVGLHAEIGRRRASVVGYCVPDEEGDILVPDGSRFRQSAAPTKDYRTKLDVWAFIGQSESFGCPY